MKVSIKDLQVAMEVKNAGVEFQINDNAEKQLGDLFVTKANLIWCKGKTQKDNGVKIRWEDFIAWAEARGAAPAAKKAVAKKAAK
ncbi:hypothetical protein [Hydrogenophaga defluvii]|uniref:Uncharacterized protein n=1 Tax=Hydrogenophaga defluvii TaxID=249410 RepID=A0ABW2SBG8_9BURK